jgi:Tol biopolymer transport system component
VTAGVGYYVTPTVSPDGRNIAFSHVRPFATLAVTEPVANPTSRRLGAGDYHLGHLWPRFSPSGRRIASVERLHAGERLVVLDAATGQPLRRGDRFCAHLDWLDENRVAYLSAAEGIAATTPVYVMDVTSGVNSKWLELDGQVTWLAVHPNKQTMAFVARRSGGEQSIILRDVATGSDTVIATGGQYEALRWRPDGMMLAWSGPAEGANAASNGVWVLEPQRSSPRQVVTDGYSPTWTADGGALYFARPRREGGKAGLWRYDLAQGEATKVRSDDSSMTYYYDVAGERLVIAANDATSQVFEMRLAR